MRASGRVLRGVRRRAQTLAGSGGSDAVDALRDTWSRYPREWKQDSRLNLGVDTLGEEWGGPEFADLVVEMISSYIGPDKDVIELGCGGGKFSQRIAPKCRSLLCTDISPEMIAHARNGLSERGVSGNVSFQLLNGTDFAGIDSGRADFIFSYDVLLHLQPQNVFSYLLDARRVLRDDGVFMLHQINLASVGGMDHFLSQFIGHTWKYAFDDPRRRGHIYYMSEDQMRALAEQAGLAAERIVTHGRDFLGLLRKRPSRLANRDPGSIELIKEHGVPTVYAVIDSLRFAIGSAHQFERHGFQWSQIREVKAADLAALPDGGPLEPWE